MGSIRVPLPTLLFLACAAGCAVAFGAGCAPPAEEADFLARKALLERQNQGIRELIDEARKGTLVPVDEFLLGVDEKVVADLVRFALPIERPVGEHLLLRVEKADIRFRDKYGVVTVEGNVRRHGKDRKVAVRAHGGLGKVEIDPASDRLSIRIAIDHVELLEAGVLEGVLGRGGKDLVAKKGKPLLEEALPVIQVPVGLARSIRVPGIQDGPVTVDSLTIPLDLSVERVLAAGGKLWVTVDANVGDIAGGEEGLGVTVGRKKKGGAQ